MNDLSNYAGQIRTEHELAKSKYREATQHAINCGNYLAEVKQQLPHGQYTHWVRNNCTFSIRTAQIYMRLASKAQRVAHLPIRQAVELLAAPRSLTNSQKLPVFETVDASIDSWPGFPVPHFGHCTRWFLSGDGKCQLAWLELRNESNACDVAVKSYSLTEEEFRAPTPAWALEYARQMGVKANDVRVARFVTHFAEADIAPSYAARLTWDIISRSFDPADASTVWRSGKQTPILCDHDLMVRLQAEASS